MEFAHSGTAKLDANGRADISIPLDNVPSTTQDFKLTYYGKRQEYQFQFTVTPEAKLQYTTSGSCEVTESGSSKMDIWKAPVTKPVTISEDSLRAEGGVIASQRAGDLVWVFYVTRARPQRLAVARR